MMRVQSLLRKIQNELRRILYGDKSRAYVVDREWKRDISHIVVLCQPRYFPLLGSQIN
jgi:hypothetical protein